VTKRYRAIVVAACAVALVGAGGASARLIGHARYVGKTEEGLSVTLTLTHDARRVARMRIVYRVSCDNGAQGQPSTNLFNLRINRRGRFRYRGSYIGSVDHSSNHLDVRGRVTARAASGTFTLSAVGEESGATVTCRSQAVDFHVPRKR
jgi:hypothetical protein